MLLKIIVTGVDHSQMTPLHDTWELRTPIQNKESSRLKMLRLSEIS